MWTMFDLTPSDVYKASIIHDATFTVRRATNKIHCIDRSARIRDTNSVRPLAVKLLGRPTRNFLIGGCRAWEQHGPIETGHLAV